MSPLHILFERLQGGKAVGPELIEQARVAANDLMVGRAPATGATRMLVIRDPAFSSIDDVVLQMARLFYLSDQLICDIKELGLVDQVNLGFIDEMIRTFALLKKHGVHYDAKSTQRQRILSRSKVVRR